MRVLILQCLNYNTIIYKETNKTLISGIVSIFKYETIAIYSQYTVHANSEMHKPKFDLKTMEDLNSALI